MSSPDTNKKKDVKRHRGPLMGILGVVLFALILLGLYSIFVVGRGNAPGDGQPIGEEVSTDETVSAPVEGGGQ